MSLKPLADRVLVELIEEPEVTKGGIVLPDVTRERPHRGRVIAVGDGGRDDHGNYLPIAVEVDDVVVFSKFGGTEVTDAAGDDYLILRESDLLAVEVDA